LTKEKEEIKKYRELFQKAELHPLTYKAQVNNIIPPNDQESIVTITDFKYSELTFWNGNVVEEKK
jgi:hypothetical protein